MPPKSSTAIYIHREPRVAPRSCDHETRWYAITERRLEFLIVPVVLVLVLPWAAVTIWLLVP